MDVNFKGPLRLTALAAEHMAPGSSVINISSKASLRPSPFTVVYAAAKAAQNTLTKAAAQELGPRGIRVNSIVCGMFHTDSFHKAAPDRGRPGGGLAGRLARPHRRRRRDRGHRALPRQRGVVVPHRRAHPPRRRRLLMAGRTAFDLDADEVVDAAIALLEEEGLDAVSMRSVGARLGVSPVPLYSRVGNKDALLEAMAERLMAGMAPAVERRRAVGRLRRALGHRACASASPAPPSCASCVGSSAGPVRRGLPPARRRRCGRRASSADEAVQACRLLLWAVSGFATVEGGTRPRPPRPGADRPGGDPVRRHPGRGRRPLRPPGPLRGRGHRPRPRGQRERPDEHPATPRCR